MSKRSVILAFALSVVVTAFVLGGCQPTGIGDPCEPEVVSQGGTGASEIVVETSSLQCRTRVCMFYNGQSFCTQRCNPDNGHADCLAEWFEEGPEEAGEDDEWPPAWCEAEVNVGSPGVIGTYCVPDRASDPDARDN